MARIARVAAVGAGLVLLLLVLLAAQAPALVPARPSCKPTDQTSRVYHPERLTVLAACRHVSGTVVGFFPNSDGDVHILVRLDPQFRSLLRPGDVNPDWDQCRAGCLIVEPVCVSPVEPDDLAAAQACAGDRDPLRLLPKDGDHVWLEGRYVLDVPHGAWAELHPLYRWGLLPVVPSLSPSL